MPIEHSHGKARPTLARLRDVPAATAVPERTGQRDAKGRFVPGNSQGCGRGWKVAVSKQLGRELKGEAEAVAREAYKLYMAFLRELPSDGPTIRQLCAQRARAAVLSGRYATRAAEAGYDTDDGRRALELSLKLDQRAERLAVTAWDLAARQAKRDNSTDAGLPWLEAHAKETPT